MKKTAQSPRKEQSKNPTELMSMYVLFLRALYLVHQQNHWLTKGYQLHLLFQRIYESVAELQDEAAEKTVGVYGGLEKQENVGALFAKLRGLSDDPVERSLKAEKAFQEFATKVYNTLKDSGGLTLGVDDMIMSQISKSEVHTYLLQQSLKDQA